MNRSATWCALVLGVALGLFPGSANARQQGVPTLSTDDVRNDPSTVTSNTAARPEPADGAVRAEAPVKGRSAGYTLVTTASGYRFERPSSWTQIENLAPQNAPGYFKYDAIFQDPATGAVLSAISVDRSQLQAPIDISDTPSLNTLLATMLNPAGSKDGVKIFRQLAGEGENGSKWLRIKAQGNGHADDGSVVETVFWVQVVQTDTRLALVAVGYPATQQEVVAQAAFHSVKTLEIHDGAGSEGAADQPGRP